jgi:CDP-diacylglycerol--glycerol-3-phosphate 3-phosphatidyltransferase
MARPRSFTLLPHAVPRRLTDPIVLRLARAGVSPNHLTVLGFAGNVGAGALAGTGRFLEAGVVTLVASALDLLDGALARATGRASAFGAVLDSTLDRLSEAAVLGGLAFYFAQRGDREEVVLCFAALAGSLLVSYVRARAQYYGLDLREGLFTRPERVLLLGGGLIIDQVPIALWILAVMASLTAAQRVYVVWDNFRRSPPPPEGRAVSKEEQP